MSAKKEKMWKKFASVKAGFSAAAQHVLMLLTLDVSMSFISVIPKYLHSEDKKITYSLKAYSFPDRSGKWCRFTYFIQ